MSDPRDAGHGGHRNPLPPTCGELFRVSGRNEYQTIATVEAALIEPTSPPSFRVRSEHGARWRLVSKDDSMDGCRWFGTPLPADPDAPEG